MTITPEKVQSALEKIFPGRQIKVTLRYEVLVDGQRVQATNALQGKGSFSGGVAVDFHNVHGAATVTDIMEFFKRNVKEHLDRQEEK